VEKLPVPSEWLIQKNIFEDQGLGKEKLNPAGVRFGR